MKNKLLMFSLMGTLTTTLALQADIYTSASPAAKDEEGPQQRWFWQDDAKRREGLDRGPQGGAVVTKGRSDGWRKRRRYFTNYDPEGNRENKKLRDVEEEKLSKKEE